MDTTTYILIGSGVFLIAVLIVFLIIRRRLRAGIDLTKDDIQLLSKKTFGEYEIKSFISRGQLSTTFEAYDTVNEKNVALRILKQEYLLNQAAVKQFKLKSQNLKYFSDHYPAKMLISNVEIGEEIFESELRPYIVTDLIDGTTLAEVLNKYDKLHPSDAFEIVNQLSRFISIAHLQKVFVHELSPENIVLNTNEKGKLEVVLADIGIAYKNLPLEEFKENKKDYYSPEEKTDSVLNDRTDVYALAALLFKMLTGKTVNRENIEDAGHLHKALRAALSEDMMNRPESIVEFIVSLNELSGVKSLAKEMNWVHVIGKLATKKISRKNIKRSMVKKYSYKRKKKRGFGYFIKYIFSIIALGLGKLWEWLWTPKKVLIILIILVVLLGIYLYYTFTTISGEIIINVRELSARIPYEKIDKIIVQVEAKDRISNALVPLEFSTLDEDAEPQDSKIVLETNKDGIALAKYTGREDPDNIMLVYKVVASGTEYENEYIDKVVTDTPLVTGRHFKTIRLRPIVSDEIPVLASIEGLPLARGDKPPETFKIDVYLSDPEGKPTDNAMLYLKSDIDAEDSTLLEYRGGSFVLTENPLKNTPYYLRYIVDDSTTLKLKLIIEPEGSSNFNFENEAEPVMISKGGDKPEPVEPVIALDEEIALQYKFIVFNEAGEKMRGVKFFIQASDVESEDDKDILITDDNGEVLYPDKPIQVLDRFWATNVESEDPDADSLIHYKIWLKIPAEPYPRNESRNAIKWIRPPDPSTIVFRIELNMQNMEMTFIE